jgi:hypothetical protein
MTFSDFLKLSKGKILLISFLIIFVLASIIILSYSLVNPKSIASGPLGLTGGILLGLSLIPVTIYLTKEFGCKSNQYYY